MLLVVPMLGGCVGAAADLAALPFRATGEVIDRTTISQKEADERRGRAIRQDEAWERRHDR